MSDTILITGGAGFIGSNFVRYLIDKEVNIINLDALTYAGNLHNIEEFKAKKNYRFVYGRIQDSELVDQLCADHKISGIINFAAESHVDRSIIDARPFIDTNITGTLVLLDAVRRHDIKRFLQISTDEVYGSLGNEGKFTEQTPLSPNSPYSASKASADHLVMSYVNTYGIDAVITRCSNNYGPYQFPEKLIPLMIANASENKKLPVYGDGMHVRDWIHVNDHISAVWEVYVKGKNGEVYNIGGNGGGGENSEKTNIEIVKTLLNILDKPESLIEYVKDRPGHDRRYAIDSSKIENEIGWKPEINLEQGLEETVEWYMNNMDWVNNIRTGAYLDYYKKQYGDIYFDR